MNDCKGKYCDETNCICEEVCPVCLERETHSHDFDKEAKKLDEIFSKMGSENGCYDSARPTWLK